MKGGLGNLMKQAQKMQENLQKAQAEIAAMEITGESGGGLVSVVVADDDAVEAGRAGVGELLADFGRRVDQDGRRLLRVRPRPAPLL